ncbi:transporter [uncultured Methylobacterium sp.]|uniref:transporter n=1 Tax=uncultured Methylobacterium sp. TaxID=157278 RepID=UPI0035CAE028
MCKNWIAAGAVTAAFGLMATTSHAQTTTVPGEQVGLAVGAPLPEGIYAIDTFTYRSPDGPNANSADTSVNVPVLVWSTPWKIFDARIEAVVAQPTVFVFPRANGGRDFSINVGTLVGSIFAWDLGNNVGFSYLAAVHLNDLNAGRGLPIFSSNTYRQGFALSYTGDGYNLTANLTHNIYDSPGRFEGRFGGLGQFFIADALTLDLTATKKFGKFEIGAIGYGTTDLPGRIPVGAVNATSYSKAGRFALGGLIGYDFGPFTAQAWIARDVVTRATQISPITGFSNGRDAYSTEGWVRIIAPLYSPTLVAAAPAPLIRKY